MRILSFDTTLRMGYRFLLSLKKLVFILLLFSVGGCAQLGFLSGGFFDIGPTVLASCSEKIPASSSPGGETFVRPIHCDTLDQAKAALTGGNLPVAEEKFKASIEALTIDPTRRVDLRSAWYGLAATYDDQKRFTDADKAYEAIRGSFGEDVRYYNNYGYSLYLRGNFAKAEQQFRAALALKPNDERVLSNLQLVSSAQQSNVPSNDSAEGALSLPYAPPSDLGAAPAVGLPTGN